MNDDPDRIPRTLEQFAAHLRQLTTCGDWVDAFAEGDAIGSEEAAFIVGCSPQTIRRKAAEAAAAGRPIGIWFAQSLWLISKRRLLADIEKRDGRHERLAAESRAKEYAKMNAPPQNSAEMDAPQQAHG